MTGGPVWSDRYDGEMRDVFDLQDEITRGVVASILTTVHLSTIPEPIERSTRPNLTVWELTMRAWLLVYDFTPESFAHAKTLQERALATDPESAEADMVLSVVNHHTAILGFTSETASAMEAAYALASHAIQLDDRHEYAHWALGISCWALLKFDESLSALERAVARNPNCSVGYGSLGTLLSKIGRPEEAFVNHETAIRSNPLDPSIFFRFPGLAFAHYIAGRFETAIECAERAIHRNPRWFWSHFILAASHVALDQIDGAVQSVQACQIALPGVYCRYGPRSLPKCRPNGGVLSTLSSGRLACYAPNPVALRPQRKNISFDGRAAASR
jgi:tetratricopeptide (TPR) repeat protein